MTHATAMIPGIVFFAFALLPWINAQVTNFAVIGDWGVGPDGDYSLLSGSALNSTALRYTGQLAVAKAMGVLCEKLKCKFVLSNGDKFYDLGISKDLGVYDPQWQTSFERVYTAKSLQKIKFYGALGNHDYGINTAKSNHSIIPQFEYTFFDPKQRFYTPSRFYSVRPPNSAVKLQITVLDSAPSILRYCTDNTSKYHSEELVHNCGEAQRKAMLEFGEREMVNARKSNLWSIVVGHHPLYDAGRKQANSPFLEQIVPILNNTKSSPHVFFSGTTHILSEYVEPSAPKTKFFIVGSSAFAVPANMPTDDPRFTFATPEVGFAIVTLTRTKGSLSFYTVDPLVPATWTSPKLVKTVTFNK